MCPSSAVSTSTSLVTDTIHDYIVVFFTMYELDAHVIWGDTQHRLMNRVIESVIKFIEGQNWTYRLEVDKPVIQMEVTGNSGQWKCAVVIGGNTEHVLFMSIFPGFVHAGRRAACAELLSRINFGLTHGCFELDFDDGEIRYRTCVPVIEGQVPPQALEYLVFTNLLRVDRFFAPIMKVIFADVCPRQALRSAQLQPETQARFELN